MRGAVDQPEGFTTVLVKCVIQTLKAKKIGIFRDSTAFGQTGLASVLNALKPFNVRPVGEEIYNPGDTDMTRQMLKLKNLGVDQIIVWGMGPDLIRPRQALTGSSGFPISAVESECTRYRSCSLQIRRPEKSGLERCKGHSPILKGGKVGPEVQRFNDIIKAKYGADTNSYIPNAGIWYDMMKLYAKAVEKVGSQDPDRLKGPPGRLVEVRWTDLLVLVQPSLPALKETLSPRKEWIEMSY